VKPTSLPISNKKTEDIKFRCPMGSSAKLTM